MPTPLQASQASPQASLLVTGPSLGAALPPEVLESPVDPGEVFISRMEDWRKARGWSHERFAAYLGVSVPYWRALRTGNKRLTLSVALRVIQERPEMGAILGDPFRYFAERSRRRPPGKRRHPGEVTPGGA